MKYIELTQRQRAQVDNENYEELNKHEWYAMWNPRTRSFYAARNSACTNGKRKTVRMHRVILGCKKGEMGDHIDHDTLNNQRYNLRVCTNAQNLHNRRKWTGCSSAYKGVSLRKHSYRWRVQIAFNGHNEHIGYFTNEVEAACAYDNAARKLFGNFALTNF